jgi:hypothetical protein
MTKITEYPYSVELPLSRGFTSIIEWLAAMNIREYDSEALWNNARPRVVYWFVRAQDATLFALRWSGR